MNWTPEDTERWLTDYPLPATFVWNGKRAYPRYTLKKGYGFWLRTAGPYHPPLRGLFALCHQILSGLPVGMPMPGGEQLVAELLRHAGQQDEIAFTADDLGKPLPRNPAENVPQHPTAEPEVEDNRPF
jgi:hypothetical protein